ncbi:hypothetical protein [Streptomyces spectabilis]|nr:hypothetical protein [Streptomyces spectabilis]MBB5108251.1 hypothetical protein [Streptomyces spectabilis]MCI3901012.1 hypothetical protein [Streptomyces spectabilis]
MKKPTQAQIAALHLLADGSAYRSSRAFADTSAYREGKRITAATAAALVRAGWAEWGAEAGLKRPLTITDAGRAQLPDAAQEG